MFLKNQKVLKFFNAKNLFIFLFLAIFTFSGFAASKKDKITDWKGKDLGEKAQSSWLVNLFEKNNSKKLIKEFKLNKNDLIFYASETSEGKEIALDNANSKAKSLAFLEIAKEAGLSELVSPVNNLENLYETWIEVLDAEGNVFYKAYSIYKMSKADFEENVALAKESQENLLLNDENSQEIYDSILDEPEVLVGEWWFFLVSINVAKKVIARYEAIF